MAKIENPNYIEEIRHKTYQELHIDLEYWKILIERYTEWKHKSYLSKSQQHYREVEQVIQEYEQNFLDKFKQECPYMAQAVTLDMAREFLQEFAAHNSLFKPSADLFRDYLLSNEIIKMEDIEL